MSTQHTRFAVPLAIALGIFVMIPSVFIVLGGSGSTPPDMCPILVVPGGERVADEHLGADQMQVATQIVHAVRAYAPTRNRPHAAVIALAAARQESGLRNLAYGDRDSLGVFQQRPSQGWGTPQQILNVTHATTSFLRHLVQVRSWMTRPVSDVAADVQRPAPQYRGRYQQWVSLATHLTQQLWAPGLDATVASGVTPDGTSVNGETVALHHANIYTGETAAQFRDDLRQVVAGRPDFVTLNEVYRRTVGELRPTGYSSWHPTGVHDARDTAVLWRTDSWTPIEKDTVRMHHRAVQWGTRYVTWVTLRSKATHQLVSVISGHASPAGPGRAGLFQDFMSRLVTLIDELSSRGPVLFGGDLNQQYPHRQPSAAVDFERQFASARAGTTFGALGEPIGGWATGQRHGATIDYIISSGAVALTHATSDLTYSDHRMISAELNLGDDTNGAISAAASAGGTAYCDPAPLDLDGTVVYPVPASLRTTNQNNWGNHGTHWAAWHTGTDFSVPCGTPVLAATSGVVEVETGPDWFGDWLVKVATGPASLTTWYAHMRRVDVRPGQQVTAGQQIGEVGDLGNATSCHLHFEVHLHHGSIYGPDNVNPSPWLAVHALPNRTRPTAHHPLVPDHRGTVHLGTAADE